MPTKIGFGFMDVGSRRQSRRVPSLLCGLGGQVTVRVPVGRGGGGDPRFFTAWRASGATAYHPYPHVMAAQEAAVGKIQGVEIHTRRLWVREAEQVDYIRETTGFPGLKMILRLDSEITQQG